MSDFVWFRDVDFREETRDRSAEVKDCSRTRTCANGAMVGRQAEKTSTAGSMTFQEHFAVASAARLRSITVLESTPN